jgi:hypothetical protein
MRVGDFSVEVVPLHGGAREIESGHVLGLAGEVYTLRLRNHGPLRAVADVTIDGRPITGGGLVLNAFSMSDLERPVHATERGRFTIIAEGSERVFGPDGGRDNPDLGLIEARFRRELPPAGLLDVFPHPLPASYPRPVPAPPYPRPITSPPHPYNQSRGTGIRGGMPRTGLGGMEPEERDGPSGPASLNRIDALMNAGSPPLAEPDAPAGQEPVDIREDRVGRDAIERAAGTGLTGSSSQEFVPVRVGELETEATVIRLRIVIGTAEALAAPRPLPITNEAPARPAARP